MSTPIALFTSAAVKHFGALAVTARRAREHSTLLPDRDVLQTLAGVGGGAARATAGQRRGREYCDGDRGSHEVFSSDCGVR